MGNQTEKNLAAARQANRFVKSELKLGAGNTLWGRIMRVDTYVRMARKEMQAELHKGVQSWEQIIDIWARMAKRYRCGNCAEHAAVAFVYLRNHNVRPIDYMAYKSGWLEDHAFVVIGRPAEGKIVQPPRQWGAGAVICDPYENDVYDPSLMVFKMGFKAAGPPDLVCRKA